MLRMSHLRYSIAWCLRGGAFNEVVSMMLGRWGADGSGPWNDRE